MDPDALVTAALEAPSPVLRGLLASLVEEVGPDRARTLLDLAGAGAGAGGPSLAEVAHVVADAQGVEGLTRPLLETLHALTGLASTYLTVVDEDEDVQEVLYSHNTLDGFALQEHLRVPWSDTLCQRALSEGRACTTDVPELWGDSQAAQDLRIQTYVSVPVRLADGRLWGTLCGADSREVPAEQHLPTLALFARLIANEVERSAALVAAKRAAEVDPLTGCTTRRGIELWFEQARQERAEAVAAVFVDLDAFKAVNDLHGHGVGDEVLRALGRQLREHSREGDLVGRYGGDEFVVAATLSDAQVPSFLARWQGPLEIEVDGAVRVEASVGSAVVPPYRVEELLDSADRAMYAAKQARQAQPTS